MPKDLEGTLRQETTADRIAYGDGALCRYCRREISLDMMSRLPGIVPTYFDDPVDNRECEFQAVFVL